MPEANGAANGAGARPGLSIACLGGGPAGLYFAISAKLRNPAHRITVIERNRPDDTFGWGVVLSDETLDNLAANDPVSAEDIRGHFAYWDDIAVVHAGHRTVSTGHGFCGIGRKRLLLILQERARALGVALRFETEVESTASTPARGSSMPRPSGRTSRPAATSSSGSARRRPSTTHSPSSSNAPSRVGSGPTPTSSNRARRRSSWNARRPPTTPSASRP